jgi:hypothetical protein
MDAHRRCGAGSVVDDGSHRGGHMLRRIRNGRDPFWDDGVGARERNQRAWIESMIAFSLSITACGLTLALWIQPFVPVVGQLTGH